MFSVGAYLAVANLSCWSAAVGCAMSLESECFVAYLLQGVCPVRRFPGLDNPGHFPATEYAFALSDRGRCLQPGHSLLRVASMRWVSCQRQLSAMHCPIADCPGCLAPSTQDVTRDQLTDSSVVRRSGFYLLHRIFLPAQVQIFQEVLQCEKVRLYTSCWCQAFSQCSCPPAHDCMTRVD